MPKYYYRCNDCSEAYYVWHGMTEDLEECTECSSKSIARIPSIILTTTDTGSRAKPGHVVNKKIEDTKREIAEYKKEISKERK
jgi:putative FmdB family regulatory protein